MIQLPVQQTLIGFVYSDATDPNNHRVWLDLRMFDRTICHIFCDKVSIDAECGSKAWSTTATTGQIFNHGRILIESKCHIEVLSVSPLHLKISGPVTLPRKQNNIEGINEAKLTYDTKSNVWVLTVKDKDNALERLQATDLLCTVAMTSHKTEDLVPKFSMMLNTAEISSYKVVGSVLVIA